jgi:hypothetical protein
MLERRFYRIFEKKIIINKIKNINNRDIDNFIMERYFGIKNNSKNHRVSYYWKNKDSCDVNAVMHRYKWSCNDYIVTVSKDTYNIIKYNKNNKIMDIKNKDEVSDSNSDSELDGVTNSDLDDLTSSNSNSNFDVDPEILLGFKFDDYMEEKDVNSHVPEWNEFGVCNYCEYKMDNRNLVSDQKNFDETFHMN